MIHEAYTSEKKSWKLAALESMGRSADVRWKAQVLESILSDDADFQYEAIRAAGELELKAARATLMKILAEEVSNNDVYYQTIWALSKIGGETVRETLQELLEHAQDDEEIEVLEMAMENLDFTDDSSPMIFLRSTRGFNTKMEDTQKRMHVFVHGIVQELGFVSLCSITV
jgi:HEAT repeat protein